VSKFKKEDLQDLIWDDYDNEVFDVIYDKIIDTTRWSVVNEMVFRFQDKFYKTSYSSGATESQDESPYEHEPDLIEVNEVVPREFTVIRYIGVGNE
jgi:hypothetical protein